MKDLVLTSLATYRVSKFLLDDELVREPRDAILDRLQKIDNPAARKLEYLLQCPWCISIWAAGGLVLFTALAPKSAAVLKTVLSASAVSGALSERVA